MIITNFKAKTSESELCKCSSRKATLTPGKIFTRKKFRNILNINLKFEYIIKTDQLA